MKVGRLGKALSVVTLSNSGSCVGKQSSSRARPLIFQRANSTFPKTSLEKSRGIGLWKGRGPKNIGQCSSTQTQDHCIPMIQKSSKGGRRPAWKSREVLAILKWKKEVYGMLKKEQVHERSMGTSLGYAGMQQGRALSTWN